MSYYNEFFFSVMLGLKLVCEFRTVELLIYVNGKVATYIVDISHSLEGRGRRNGSVIADCPTPASFRGTTVTVKLFSGSGWSMEYSRVVSSTDTVLFSPLVVLVMVTL